MGKNLAISKIRVNFEICFLERDSTGDRESAFCFVFFFFFAKRYFCKTMEKQHKKIWTTFCNKFVGHMPKMRQNEHEKIF